MGETMEERLERELIVSRNPEVLSGDLVFRGTGVPVETLVDHLKSGYSVEVGTGCAYSFGFRRRLRAP